MVGTGSRLEVITFIGMMEETMKNVLTIQLISGTDTAMVVGRFSKGNHPVGSLEVNPDGSAHGVVEVLGEMENYTRNVGTEIQDNGIVMMEILGLKLMANISDGMKDERAKNVLTAKTIVGINSAMAVGYL